MNDVVVVGAGVIGLGIAWRAAALGLRTTVVDPQPGRGASMAAAGMLAPVSELAHGEGPLLAAGLESLHRYPAFVRDLRDVAEPDVGLRPAGTLLVGLDADDVAVLRVQRDLQESHGVTPERLTGSGCRRLEPGLSPRVRGGLLVAGDRSVSPRRLHAALSQACRTAGAASVHRRAVGLRAAGGRVTGVHLDDGTTLPAGQVVVAAGAHSADLAGVPAEEVPVRPVSGQVLRLRGPRLLDRTVRALVHGRPVYLVPDDAGGVVVGATVEDRGRDDRVTAGAVLDLLRDATDVVPGVGELELREVLARWRPCTPDNLPVIGRSRVPGLVLATGHYRHGVLLTPVTADGVARLLTGGASLPELEPFCPSRFSRSTTTSTTHDQEVARCR